mmetsp:Transcript_32934/g.95366  ORF Transcript_32934/g.95366 Transcript_32934/m.95366 type:complete len:226 (+) Transcript_32934:383-1060(+)
MVLGCLHLRRDRPDGAASLCSEAAASARWPASSSALRRSSRCCCLSRAAASFCLAFSSKRRHLSFWALALPNWNRKSVRISPKNSLHPTVEGSSPKLLSIFANIVCTSENSSSAFLVSSLAWTKNGCICSTKRSSGRFLPFFWSFSLCWIWDSSRETFFSRVLKSAETAWRGWRRAMGTCSSSSWTWSKVGSNCWHQSAMKCMRVCLLSTDLIVASLLRASSLKP